MPARFFSHGLELVRHVHDIADLLFLQTKAQREGVALPLQREVVVTLLQVELVLDILDHPAFLHPLAHSH